MFLHEKYKYSCIYSIYLCALNIPAIHPSEKCDGRLHIGENKIVAPLNVWDNSGCSRIERQRATPTICSLFHQTGLQVTAVMLHEGRQKERAAGPLNRR